MEEYEFVRRIKTTTSGTYYVSIPSELKEIFKPDTLCKITITSIKEPDKGE